MFNLPLQNNAAYLQWLAIGCYHIDSDKTSWQMVVGMSRAKLYGLMKAGRGIQRTNQFEVEIALPLALQIPGSRFELAAYSATVPGYSISSIGDDSNAQPLPMPGAITLSELRVGFRLTNAFYERDVLEKWRLSMIPARNVVAYYDDLVGEVIVRPLTANGRSFKQFRYTGVYPNTVGEVGMSYDDENQIANLDVMFSYADYTMESAQ
jgi:hypothetical protein